MIPLGIIIDCNVPIKATGDMNAPITGVLNFNCDIRNTTTTNQVKTNRDLEAPPATASPLIMIPASKMVWHITPAKINRKAAFEILSFCSHRKVPKSANEVK